MAQKLIKSLLFLGLLILTIGQSSYSQTLPDFSSIKVDELSDQQVQSLFRRANAMGYSQADLFDLARQQGLSMSEISKLGSRLNEANNSRTARASSKVLGDTRLRESYFDSLRAKSENRSDIFGLDFFKRNSQFLTFEPNLNIPTPPDYILASGDELFIDIYGASEQYYQAIVNPEGNIVLENVGPIRLSGLSVAEAKSKIRSKLVRNYTDLAGSNPTTFFDLSLGQARSIQVSIVGEVELPGTYNLSAFSTVFNSLYVSGGITERGTLRGIRVVRGGKPIATVDVYDFLVNGNANENLRLKNDDVVIVGPYTNRVRLTGAVKIPGRFELNADESLDDLLKYAGGFNEYAYSDKIGLVRNQGNQKYVADIFKDQYPVFTPSAGDVFEIQEVLNRFGNRVQVKGAVFRPGNFAISDELTVKQLIEKAEGLKGDANRNRAFITRSNEDLSLSTISFNLDDLMNGDREDIKLQREDILQILSIYDLKEEVYVELSGEVNNAGIFPFSENMTVEDLLVMAGGFRQSASETKIEITRRSGNIETGDIGEVIVLDVDRDLNLNSGTTVSLEPFDHVIVRKNPDFFNQRFVYVEGQVNYPGQYGIVNLNERVSDLINRAGGLNRYAYVKGATLLRKTEFYTESSDLESRVNDLEKLINRMASGDSTFSESELAQLQRVNDELANVNIEEERNENLSSFAKRERLREIVQRNALYSDLQLKEAEAIGIDLEAILQNPGSKIDLILEKGDVLIVPKEKETVRLRGRLLYPTTVRYENSRSLKYFINRAGGFDTRAKRAGTYVIYANGEVAKTRRFLFFRSFPKVEPGAEIIVPAKAPKIPIATSEIVGITSGLATLALLISQINFN